MLLITCPDAEESQRVGEVIEKRDGEKDNKDVEKEQNAKTTRMNGYKIRYNMTLVDVENKKRRQ